jgi:hypothetical protein
MFFQGNLVGMAALNALKRYSTACERLLPFLTKSASTIPLLPRLRRSRNPRGPRQINHRTAASASDTEFRDLYGIAKVERTAREFARWLAVSEEDRSPAPAWWWQLTIDVVAQHEKIGALLCSRLQVSVGSTYAAGAAVLMGTLAEGRTQSECSRFNFRRAHQA